jgi:hypothetical protein
MRHMHDNASLKLLFSKAIPDTTSLNLLLSKAIPDTTSLKLFFFKAIPDIKLAKPPRGGSALACEDLSVIPKSRA